MRVRPLKAALPDSSVSQRDYAAWPIMSRPALSIWLAPLFVADALPPRYKSRCPSCWDFDVSCHLTIGIIINYSFFCTVRAPPIHQGKSNGQRRPSSPRLFPAELGFMGVMNIEGSVTMHDKTQKRDGAIGFGSHDCVGDLQYYFRLRRSA